MLNHKSPLSIISVILLIIIIGTGYSCKSTQAEEKSLLPDTLNVAVELSAMTLTTNGDTISGFSFEILEKICELHKIPYKIKVFNNIADALSDNQSNEFDLFVSNLPLTANIKERFLTTKPLYIDKLILVQNNNIGSDSIISRQMQLAGKPVWVIKNEAVAERLNNLSQEIGERIVIVETEDISEEQLVILVALGEIPRAAVSSLTAFPLLDTYKNIDTSVELSFNQFKSWILSQRDSILRDSLDLWLEDFKTSPEFADLAKKYNVDNP